MFTIHTRPGNNIGSITRSPWELFAPKFCHIIFVAVLFCSLGKNNILKRSNSSFVCGAFCYYNHYRYYLLILGNSLFINFVASGRPWMYLILMTLFTYSFAYWLLPKPPIHINQHYSSV